MAFDEEQVNEDGDFLNPTETDAVVQKAALAIDLQNGAIKEQSPLNATVVLEITNKMVLDKNGLTHSGYIFSSAAYAALLAVNHPNALVIGAEVKFLAPIELGNEITFKARCLQEDTKKREVRVDGFVLDIKIFDAMIYVAVFEKHVLSLHITSEMDKKLQ